MSAPSTRSQAEADGWGEDWWDNDQPKCSDCGAPLYGIDWWPSDHGSLCADCARPVEACAPEICIEQVPDELRSRYRELGLAPEASGVHVEKKRAALRQQPTLVTGRYPDG